MKDFVGENNKILENWREKFKTNHGDENSFCEDGIMYKGEFDKEGETVIRKSASNVENDLWAKASLRILFLTKDQNAQDGQAWDLRQETYRQRGSEPGEYKIDGKYRFNDLLVYVVYGLIKTTNNGTPSFEKFSNQDALKLVDETPFARINCKKEAGKESCDTKVLLDHMEMYKDELLQQIDNIDADFIVCCSQDNRGNPILDFLNRNGYNFEYLGIENCSALYDKEKNKIAIDSYHLSYCRETEKWMFEDIVKSYYLFLKEGKGVDFPPLRSGK